MKENLPSILAQKAAPGFKQADVRIEAMLQVSKQQVRQHYQRQQPNKTVAWFLGIIWVAGILFNAAFRSSWLGLVVFLLLITLMAIGYTKIVDRQGCRRNDYDPLKTDSELERTSFGWKRFWRFLVPYTLAYVSFTAANWTNSWLLIAVLAVLAGGGLVWFFGANPSQPEEYVPPTALFAQEVQSAESSFSGPEAIVAFMHADELVPGINQRKESSLVSILVAAGAVEHEVKAALNEADAKGQVVRIREMRHSGAKDNWLTLTKESMREFQDAHSPAKA